jgi:hypothetical protein
VLLIAAAQIFTATQFVLEEWILEHYAMDIKVAISAGICPSNNKIHDQHADDSNQKAEHAFPLLLQRRSSQLRSSCWRSGF